MFALSSGPTTKSGLIWSSFAAMSAVLKFSSIKIASLIFCLSNAAKAPAFKASPRRSLGPD